MVQSETRPLRRLLLLDEPFGALDPQVRKSLRSGLKKIIDRVGITAIFVTHDQARSQPSKNPGSNPDVSGGTHLSTEAAFCTA